MWTYHDCAQWLNNALERIKRFRPIHNDTPDMRYVITEAIFNDNYNQHKASRAYFHLRFNQWDENRREGMISAVDFFPSQDDYATAIEKFGYEVDKGKNEYLEQAIKAKLVTRISDATADRNEALRQQANRFAEIDAQREKLIADLSNEVLEYGAELELTRKKEKELQAEVTRLKAELESIKKRAFTPRKGTFLNRIAISLHKKV